MSQFTNLSLLNQLDQSKSDKGQKRKALEHAANSSLLNASTLSNANFKTGATNFSGLLSSPVAKKKPNDSLRMTPKSSSINSPVNSLAETRARTPGRKTPSALDRFIPSRSGTDFDKSHFRMIYRDLTALEDNLSPSKREFQLKMVKSLMTTQEQDAGRILNFQTKSNLEAEASPSRLKIQNSHPRSPSSSAKKNLFSNRNIPLVPERILDAPDIVNDYYLNLLDWSATNFLAVGLGSNVFLWNGDNGDIRHLLELDCSEDYVSSVRWMKEGNILAVGNSMGEIGLWDIEKNKKVRNLLGHTDRVGSLSWNKYILSSGSRSGEICHSDVRASNHLVSTIVAHTLEVCGLAWSPDGRYLASGGNDNLLKIWPSAEGECFSQSEPKFVFNNHLAAVKAVSWCPWQTGILATGGGTADKTIKIWNINNGTLINSVDAKSQVCALAWAPEYKELVSAQGQDTNEVTIWKYPSMVKAAELLGHTDRVLHLAMSGDETTVVSGGADETLRLWKCFVPDPNKKKLLEKSQNLKSSILRTSIR